MEEERGTETESEREREMLCCNAMLNSNMQCSHHGNGGSSEASHGAENPVLDVCLLANLCVSACVSMCRCICAKALQKMQRSSAGRERVFNMAQDRRKRHSGEVRNKNEGS